MRELKIMYVNRLPQYLGLNTYDFLLRDTNIIKLALAVFNQQIMNSLNFLFLQETSVRELTLSFTFNSNVVLLDVPEVSKSSLLSFTLVFESQISTAD